MMLLHQVPRGEWDSNQEAHRKAHRIRRLIGREELSKEAHIKDVECGDVGWNLHTVDVIIDPSYHRDMANLFRLQFVVSMRRHAIVSQMNPHQITCIEHNSSTAGVSSCFVFDGRSFKLY